MNDKLPRKNCTVTDTYGCDKANNRVTRPRSAKVGAKRRRLYIQQRDSSCSDKEESVDNAHIETPATNGMTSNMSELMYQDRKGHHYSTGLHLDTDAQGDKELCVICRHGENLLSCTGRGCKRSFHLGCLNPPLSYIPPGAWYCIWCVRQKIESGVHVVSPGAEAILDIQDVPADDEGRAGEKQYLVKYKGLAHVHSRWIPERELILQASMLLYKYKKRIQKVDWKTDWSIPHCLLQKRLLLFPEEIAGDPNSRRYEWLVKWRGLSYEHATWESEDSSFLKAPEAKKLIEYYEQRHKRATSELYTSEVDEGDHLQFSNCVFKGFKDSDEIGNDHTMYVNYLHQTWLRGQNSIIIDEQERITRVVLFILSLQKDVNQPSLIITTSQFLSMYEAEFSRWLPSANVVVYRGNKDVRVMIRTLEFYNESGCIMFQVLLSTLKVVIEDQDSIESLNWAVIFVDESQRPSVSVRVNQIKTLHAYMRFLIIADHIKDTRSNYFNILSFVDHKHVEYQDDSADAKANNDTLKLKEKMNQFLAYRCPFTARRFLEYWVPVQLSDVQREQYCATLLSNSPLLCSSSSRANSFESLHNVMLSSRKCCDHPYLVNSSLRNSVIQGINDAQRLDAEIEISGKLRLLDKILGKIKERGLRVLILFQTIGTSGLVSIGDIIDDFIHQRYGDSYTRIDEDIPCFKKREAANLFNNDGEKFICLIETRACVPTIKLQSVDTIILFDSNWEPLNDLKSLQKMTISSQFDQVKVFRLYSSCTLEEGLLLFAKERVSIGCSLQNMKKGTCQRLLSWGASYQFQLLNSPDGSQSNVSYGQALLEQVLSELVVLLPSNCGNISSTGREVISEVQLTEGAFSCDISLLGELENRLDNVSTWQLCENDEPPHIFWKNLLEERLCPRFGKVRRKIQRLNALGEESKLDSEDWNDSMKETNGTANLSSMKYKLLAKKKLIHEGKKRKFTVNEQFSHGNNSRSKNRKIREKGKALSLKNNMTIRKQIKAVPIGRRVPTLFGSCATQDLESPARNNVSPVHEVPGQFISSSQPNISYSTFVDENSRISRSLDGTNVMFDAKNNPHVEFSPSASEMPKPEIPGESILHSAGADPWQIELDKIQRDLELATKLHEEKRLQLQCDCKKEINEIQKKYAMSLESVETAFMHKREDLLTSYKLVSINKSLAGVMMQMRSSAHAAGFEGTQKVTISAFMEEIFQLFMAPTSITNTPLVEENLLEPDEAVARMTTSGERSLANPCTELVSATSSSVDAVEDSLAVTLPDRSCGHQGQLSIPNIRGGGNHQTGGIVRATAPHLRNIRHQPGPSYA